MALLTSYVIIATAYYYPTPGACLPALKALAFFHAEMAPAFIIMFVQGEFSISELYKIVETYIINL